MIDTVLAAPASPPFQSADRCHQPIMARQDNLAAVEPWQQLLIQIALRLLAQFVADAVLAEWLTAAKGLPGISGVMYTTWEFKYNDLEKFASLVPSN